MKAVISAGGKGSRISSLFPDIPKPMIPLCGKPVLERAIETLRRNGITDIILTVGYLGDKIVEHFADGSRYGVDITYCRETEPLGSAGALFLLREKLTEDFLFINGDTVFDIDIDRLLCFHRTVKAAVTLFTHPNNHPYDSGLIVCEESGRVKDILTKHDKRPVSYKNRVNAGIQVVSPRVFSLLSHQGGKALDMDRDIIKPLARCGEVYCFDSTEYVADMGTPERYRAVSRDMESGKIRRRNHLFPQKAIFLDRDGTLNRHVGYVRCEKELTLNPGAAEAVRLINASDYLAVVVTNQPVIARGEVTALQLALIHDRLETLLGQQRAYIDGIYYCPHHPDSGFEGEIPALKINCDCRKPKPGLLLRAAQDMNIDLSASYLIGDSETDTLCAENAGCCGIRIKTDEPLPDIIRKILSDQ